MSQLLKVFRFEFSGYLRRRSFKVLTVLLVIGIAVVLSWPRVSGLLGMDGEGAEEGAGGAVTQVAFTGGAATQEMADALATAMPGYEFVLLEDGASARAVVESGEFGEAVVLESELSYQRYARKIDFVDNFSYALDAALVSVYQVNTLAEYGVPEGEIAGILQAPVQGEVVVLGADGQDGSANFIYAYILMFVLYFAILMYGNFVATSVATEKSTRAMELLITSTKPVNLMFGKVLGAGCAGLTQLVLILGSAVLFYNLNAEFYVDNYLINSVFNMPVSLLGYTLLFFVLGFFIYAFLFAALASLVSRMEDLSTATLPVTWIFIIAFMVTMFSMVNMFGDGVDNPVMLFCSFFPLTSPMAMFVRIAVGDVSALQIILSVGILVVSTFGIGLLASAIYRIGVLLYGNAPKPKELFAMLKSKA